MVVKLLSSRHLRGGGQPLHHPALTVNLWGMEFANPVGMAAGFDKNAVMIESLLGRGFGFVEAGTVTKLPQEGNPKPRIFRLVQDEAIINRLGFNSEGIEEFTANIQGWQQRQKILLSKGIVGANIGKNRDSENAVEDYIYLLEKLYNQVDYITINISSPNTPGLRDLQKGEALDELLGSIILKKNELCAEIEKKTPILLKISPDISLEDKENIAYAAIKHNIDGLIISNTTINHRDGLLSKNAGQKGGLSGKPLLQPSTDLLRDIYLLTEGKIPLIGVGGVSSGEDAYRKIRAGASLIQLYSAIIYQGFSLVKQINQELLHLLERDGFSNISEAVGVDAQL